jgi:hypothetical protein
MTMLADHPHVLARLREEVSNTLGPNGKVNHENVREMKYLRAVLNGRHFLAPRRQSKLTCSRDFEAVSKCVRTNTHLYSHYEAEKMITVHGISDAPRKTLSGQGLMEESRSTFRVVRKFIMCPGCCNEERTSGAPMVSSYSFPQTSQ